MLLTEDRIRTSPTGAAVALSLFLHCLVLAIVVGFSKWPAPDLDATARQQRRLLAEARKRPNAIIWFRPRRKLPNISPSEAKPKTRSQNSNSLYLRVNPPDAPHRDQYIRVREPLIKDQKVLPSPNVVMYEVVAPAPQRQPARLFVPPADQIPKPQAPKLDEPDIQLRELHNDADAIPGSLRDARRPPGKKFTAPTDQPNRQGRQVTLDEPQGLPQTASSMSSPKLPVDSGLLNGAKPQGRRFVPPSSLSGKGDGAGGGAGRAAAPRVEEPEVGSRALPPGAPGPITAIILSASPPPDGRLIRPEGNRPAQVNAGVEGGPGRGTGAGSGPADLVVPGLTVRGGGNSGSGSSAERPTTAPATPDTRAAYRPRLDTPTVSIPQRPNARLVPPPVESAFRSRTVYSALISRPAGLGDWIIWFSELQAAPPGSRSIMRPPKVEAGISNLSNASLPASAKCWIRARLNVQGHLTALEVVQGISGEKALELAALLEKWLWIPAIRNNEAVEVEVMVEADLRRAN